MPIPRDPFGQTFAKHRSLQVIADPLYWRQSAVQPSIAGIMQPADFDITAYTALDDTAAYERPASPLSSGTPSPGGRMVCRRRRLRNTLRVRMAGQQLLDVGCADRSTRSRAMTR